MSNTLDEKRQTALDSIEFTDEDIKQCREDGRDLNNIKKYLYISKNANPNERDDGIGYGEQLVLREYATETTKLTGKAQAFIDDRFNYYVENPAQLKENK